MKEPSRTQKLTRRSSRSLLGRLLLGASLVACGARAPAAEGNKPVLTQEEIFEGGTNTHLNWIEFSVGGLFVSGEEALAMQRHRMNDGAFGGIEDFHYEKDVAENTTLSVDGRALPDNHDYKFGIGLKRENLGFFRFNYENFRTWTAGVGGRYSPAGLPSYSLPDDTHELDCGEFSFEAGLTLKSIPQATLKYTHRYRDGERSSTIWGPLHPSTIGPTRGLYPSFRDIDETVDVFELDLKYHIKKTDVGLGLRYETADLDNALKTTSWYNEPNEQRTTDRQRTSYDLFSVHAFSETWIRKDLFFSAGYLFASLDSDFSGSRIHGTDFDVGYTPGYPLGYTNMLGSLDKREHVLNLNLMAGPWKHFSLVPSLRVRKEDWDAYSRGVGTLDNATGPFSGESERENLELTERLDLRYTGVTNWVFTAGGEWMQSHGNLSENGRLSQIGGIGVAPIQRESDDSRSVQKYALGAKWYPNRTLAVDVGGYFKTREHDYDHTVDSTANDSPANRYPAYLVMQGFRTYDANARLTLRPFKRVAFVSRYEYQLSTVDTTPDSVAGLDEIESSQMASHIFAQNVSWTFASRVNFQSGYSYVWSETKSSASDFTRAVLDAANNYFTVNFSASVVLDDKTDLNLGYFFYLADNFKDNSVDGVPYGTGAREHGATATLTRRLTQNVRLNLRYAYNNCRDWAGSGDFESHVVFSSLQYRF